MPRTTDPDDNLLQQARALATRAHLAGTPPEETFRQLQAAFPHLYPAHAKAIALGWSHYELHRRFLVLMADPRYNPHGESPEGVSVGRVGEWVQGRHRPTGVKLLVMCLLLGERRQVLFPGPDDHIDQQLDQLLTARHTAAIKHSEPAEPAPEGSGLWPAGERLPALDSEVPLRADGEVYALPVIQPAPGAAAAAPDPAPQPQEGGGSVDRRTFTIGVAAAGAGLAADEPALVFEALERGQRADTSDLADATVDEVEALAFRLGADYWTLDPAVLHAALRGHLRRVDGLLTRRLTTRHRRRLQAAAARLSLLYATTVEELGRPAAAEHHGRTAYRLARQAGDPDLAARCLNELAATAMDRGAFGRALAYVRLGERLAPARTAPSVWLPRREARLLVLQGRPGALEAVKRADQRAALVPATPELGWWGYNPHETHSIAAFVHARAGEAARAVEHATEALRHWPHSPHHQVRFHVDLGLARLAQGEVDAAVGEATAALAHYRQRPSALSGERLAELDAALHARHPRAAAVREFHDAYLAARAG